MDAAVFVLNFASGISMLLVIYAAYMMIGNSKGDFANAFKVILFGHVPSAAVHFLASLSFFGLNVLPGNGGVYEALNQTCQVISALSVFAAIYLVKKTLYDKIAQFAGKFGKGGRSG